MRKKELFILIILFSVFTSGYLLFKPAYNYLSNYLSKSEQVKANILIVEGWLPDYALEMAYEEFQKNGYEYIITTGLKSISDYFMFSVHGYLIFYTKDKLSNTGTTNHHIIDIDVFGNLGGDNRSHFNLIINDSLVARYIAERRKIKNRVRWEGNIKEIDSVAIQFIRDTVGDKGDRKLFVKEIIIDHKNRLRYLNNTEFDIGSLDGKNRINNNSNSRAEFARNSLLSMGIDSSHIIPIPGKKAKINRTLTSAKAFRDWLKTTEIDVKGINIISIGMHSRRTWMTYNKMLDEKYPIGIISLPDYKYYDTGINRFLKTIRETLGLIYYWSILIPY